MAEKNLFKIKYNSSNSKRLKIFCLFWEKYIFINLSLMTSSIKN